MKKTSLLLAVALVAAMTGSSRLSANTGPNGTKPRRGKDIATAEADALIAKATQIRAVIGC